jgi:hypothetical protein
MPQVGSQRLIEKILCKEDDEVFFSKTKPLPCGKTIDKAVHVSNCFYLLAR